MSRNGTCLLVLAWGCTAGHAADFSSEIRSIFESSCWKCHGGAAQLSKLDLRTRDAALKGGTRGPAIVPGKAAESRLYRVVAGIEKPAMPLDGKLSAEQIKTIREWIEQGAPWAEGGTAPSTEL